MFKQKYFQKRFFWVVLWSCLLLSGGHINATSAQIKSSDLIINELMAANGTILADEDGDYSDWIEIYNQSNAPVNLSGWALTDDPNQPQKWPFPQMTLGSQQYLIVFASSKDRASPEAGAALHTNFNLNKSGEFLALHNILEGRFMDTISPHYPEQFRDVSYGRYGAELNFGFLPVPSPGQPNDESLVQTGAVAPVRFSVERGFYEAPFTVELATDTVDATIRYTTDGSEPTESNGTTYTEPISIQDTTLLRAAAFKPGFIPAPATTQSYLFLPDILDQFPDTTSLAANLQQSFGTAIVQTAKAADLTAAENALSEGLLSIPSVSLVTDAQSQASFYSQPAKSGWESEQPISVELIYPDGSSPGIQVNAGIRPFGAAEVSTAKQSFRLFFRGEYGSTNFEYPLFPDSPVESFDTLVLQAIGQSGPVENGSYTRNQWLRASQIAMSGFGSHGLFVNLYLNGNYLGLYNLIEKPNADFMASYLGGEQDDWFVADQAGPLNNNLGPQATELNYLYTTLALAPMVDVELTQPELLAATYKAAASYLDPSQLSDYMLLDWYAETMGWPQSNWYAAARLEDLPGRGKLLLGEELTAAQTTSSQQVGNQPANIHRSLLETLLASSADFKTTFADRLYQQLANNGPLTDANAQARWQELNQAIEPAIMADLAHAGAIDNLASGQAADELAFSAEVLAQMAGNAARLIAQAREAGYYPAFDPPRFSQNGGLVEAGFRLAMSLADSRCSTCVIYYTTDGTDPRLPVTGEVIPIARTYDQPVVLNSTSHIKARVWNNGVWSALQQAVFSVVEQDSKLRITEIMYNPLGGDDYEFIEFQNMGQSELDLGGFFMDQGVRFTFPAGTPPLLPGEFIVLVSNPNGFAERYPAVKIDGVYDGHFSNKGEQIILRDAAGQILLDIVYADANGWPITADGRGDSLTLVNPAGDPNNPANWRASTGLYGSPGAVDPAN